MFWSNFYELCLARGTTPSAVLRELGMAGGLVTKWKRGATPTKSTLNSLAGYFGVDASEFFIPRAESDGAAVEGLTEHEGILISKYRAHPELQDAVDRLLQIGKYDSRLVYTAAYSDDKRSDEIKSMNNGNWKKIEDSSNTDERLI